MVCLGEMAATGGLEWKARVMVKVISKQNKILCQKNMLESYSIDGYIPAVCTFQSTFKKK